MRSTTLLIALLGAVGCQRHDQNFHSRSTQDSAPASEANRILKRGLPGEPRTLDPQLADDTYSFQVLRDLYEGLTALDRSGQVIPGVAESWDIDASGTRYTFHLRPRATWSNGDAITADEFVRGLRRAVDPATASGSAGLLTVIKGAGEIIAGRHAATTLGITAMGSSTVRVELEHPAPYLLQILAEPIAAPICLTGGAATATSTQAMEIVSNGPYRLVKRVPGAFIELARNPRYWDAAHVAIGAVRYVIEDSEATELRSYRAGQLDLTYTVPIPDLTRVKQTMATQLQTAPIAGTLYLALNLSRPPFRDNPTLRQSISMAIDRELIAQYATLGVTPAYSFVPPGIPAYRPAVYAWSEWSQDHRLQVARELYAKAGYSSDHPVHLRLYFNSGEAIQRIMIAVAENLKQNLGIDSELQADEFRVFLTGRKDRQKWEIARLGWWADFEDAENFLGIFSKDSAQNDPYYVSDSFESALGAARAEPAVSRRASLLHRSEEILLADYPIIPIYFYTAARLVKPDLGGAAISPSNRTYSRHLYWKTPD